MKFILTPEECRKADSEAINKYGISSLILMENAAGKCEEVVKSKLAFGKSILILCGSGNNGGDGYALARLLSDFYKVKIISIGEITKMSPETYSNYSSCLKIGIETKRVISEFDIDDASFHTDYIIDALIGVGGNEDLHGIVIDLLKKSNSVKAGKMSIDCPSGLNSATGNAHINTFIADVTVTMFAPKTGLYLNSGPDYSGEIVKAYLGAPSVIIEDIASNYSFEDSDLHYFLPWRDRVSSKFDYGKTVIIAGSENMPGAAALCANAAIKSGCGLVYLAAPVFHSSLVPEIIPCKTDVNHEGGISIDAYDKIMKLIEGADSIAVGPGLGSSEETIELITKVLNNSPENIPIVIDADALKAVKNIKLRENMILTPHIGEFAYLTGKSRQEIDVNSLDAAKSFAESHDCILHLKHVPSFSSDGKTTIWCISGNPGMASAGSGDVLTGIAASFCAQGLNPLFAIGLAAFAHGKAGDEAVKTRSMASLTASDIIEALPQVFFGAENWGD